MIIQILIGCFVLFLVILGIHLYLTRNPQFGARMTASDEAKYRLSPQWRDGNFRNQEITEMNMRARDIPALLKKQLFERKKFYPPKDLIILPLDREEFFKPDGQARFIWYGHSVILLRMGDKTILIDPMLGPDASPIAPFTARRFSRNTLDLIDTLPPLDAILMSHDHYDHLDYRSIRKLQSKTDGFIVALGVARHLQRWGVPAGQITEMDWWDEYRLGSLRILFTPSRHFSGRQINDRFKSLWGGFVFLHDNQKIFWSGDGGYGPHFKQIAQKYAPFDWAFVECGQYNEHWHQIHMYPEESVHASMDVSTACAMPVHWGGFALALHPWDDPVKRFVEAAESHNQPFYIPRPGEVVNIKNVPSQQVWWEEL